MKRTLLCLTVVLSLVACGQDPKEEAYQRLQNQVVAIRDAAEAGDAVTAVQRLTSLRANVAELRRDEVITEQETQRILTAALQVQANLPLLVPVAPAAAPPPAPAPAPPPAPAPAGGSNAGGSIGGGNGNDGNRGEKGEKGEKGGKGNEGKEDDEDDD
ncbi:MAG TPA: hypothetical protein VHI31_08465 [Actinomycetota bacterium]|nr:hypothetical protein [Actinomycetota bacterium]